MILKTIYKNWGIKKILIYQILKFLEVIFKDTR